MPNLLIVAHRPSPNVETLAAAVVAGVAEIGAVNLRLLAPLAADAQDVLWCNGLIVGTTENFGYMSGALKDFFERIYYPCLERTQGLPYALFVKAGQDGAGARSSTERIIAGLKWRAVQEALVMTGRFTPDWLAPCRELGMTMAAGLDAGVF